MGLKERPRRLPDHPTLARPGSPEKIAVLAQRVRRGEQLWHPDDFTLYPRRYRGTPPGRAG